MAISREEISKIARSAADKVIESQGKCVSAGMQLFEAQQGYRKATPIIFRVNLKGLVSEDDLKVPHSEAAMHVGAAGKNIIAFSLVGESAAFVVYDDGEGRCGFTFGLEDEIFTRPLVEKVNQLWEKRGPDYRSNPELLASAKAKPTRDNVRVEVWEERDRLHIGIQDKETGDYYASWWDDDAREMFEQGFFKSRPNLEESVLKYAEDVGILAK